MLVLILRLLHLMAMGVWFGGSLLATGDLKRTVQAGPAHFDLLRVRMDRMTRVVAPAGLLTLLTGFGLIFALGGFKAVPVPIHIGLLTATIMALVGSVGMGGLWNQIDARLKSGESAESVAPLLRRMSAFTGVFQTLWLVTLGLMVFRHGF